MPGNRNRVARGSLTVEWSRDFDYFDSLLNKTANRAKQGYCGPPITCRNLPKAHCLLVKIDEEKAGFFLFIGLDAGFWEMHVMLEPSCRGELAREAGIEAVRRFFTLTGETRLFARAVDSIPEALVFAKWLGFEVLGRHGGETVLRVSSWQQSQQLSVQV